MQRGPGIPIRGEHLQCRCPGRVLDQVEVGDGYGIVRRRPVADHLLPPLVDVGQIGQLAVRPDHGDHPESVAHAQGQQHLARPALQPLRPDHAEGIRVDQGRECRVGQSQLTGRALLAVGVGQQQIGQPFVRHPTAGRDQVADRRGERIRILGVQLLPVGVVQPACQLRGQFRGRQERGRIGGDGPEPEQQRMRGSGIDHGQAGNMPGQAVDRGPGFGQQQAARADHLPAVHQRHRKTGQRVGR